MSEKITFPPGVLGEDPVRLEVLACGEGWFALDKPAGLLLAPDALHPPETPSIVEAIQAAALAGKPQLTALGIAGCGRVHALDTEISGVAILATSESSAATLRNQLGSGAWEFVYEIVCQGADGPAERRCDRPIVRHADPNRFRMVLSAREGKRCQSHFLRSEAWGGYSLWEVRTADNRPHQVRAHAAECGLRIVGEAVYGRVRNVYLSSLKRGYRPGREQERPLHPGLAAHLRFIRCGQPGSGGFSVESRRPKTLSTLLARLQDAADAA